MGELFHNQSSLSIVMITMYLPFWLYMLDSKACIYKVCLFVRISLSRCIPMWIHEHMIIYDLSF